MSFKKEGGMSSKTKTTHLKHGPPEDSIKDFFYDSLCHTQTYKLESHKIPVDFAVGLLVKDYLKSCGKG
jgi:hypothetical protein